MNWTKSFEVIGNKVNDVIGAPLVARCHFNQELQGLNKDIAFQIQNDWDKSRRTDAQRGPRTNPN